MNCDMVRLKLAGAPAFTKKNTSLGFLPVVPVVEREEISVVTSVQKKHDFDIGAPPKTKPVDSELLIRGMLKVREETAKLIENRQAKSKQIMESMTNISKTVSKIKLSEIV